MVFGLIGEKLTHSYSPQIHKAFFELTGLNGNYKLFELRQDELAFFLQNALQEGYRGLNVTIPYKTRVIPFLKQLSPEASKIGAVNTITLNRMLTGFNTDYFGIGYTLQKSKIRINGKKALVTGSGGAAKAVVTYLLDSGLTSVYMASRAPGEVENKFSGVIAVTYDEIEQHGPFDIIINTTPVGMVPKLGFSPLTAEQIRGAGFIFDLIYNPMKTELMKLADLKDIPNVNGLYMLVAQAVKAQEIWNDKAYGLDLVDAIYIKMRGHSSSG